MPAKAGIQNYLKILDSRLRGNDAKRGFMTFYDTINVRRSSVLSSIKLSAFQAGVKADFGHPVHFYSH